MFRKPFWHRHKSAIPQGHLHQKRNIYNFASVHRANQALKRGHYRNRDLNSTSVGQTTLERYGQSQASTMFEGPREVPARPPPIFQLNSRPRRLFNSLGSIGSNVISSVTRSRLMSRAVPSQGVDLTEISTESGGNTCKWAIDLEKGKRANDTVTNVTEHSTFPGFSNENNRLGVLPSASTTVQSAAQSL